MSMFTVTVSPVLLEIGVIFVMMADYSRATTSSPYAWPSVVMVTSSCGCERTTTESADPVEKDANTKDSPMRKYYLLTF